MWKSVAVGMAMMSASLPVHAACNARGISGAWLADVRQVDWDEYSGLPATISGGVCLFLISPSEPGVADVDIRCPGRGYFALEQQDFDFDPEHQLVRVGRTCRWRLVDRAGLDGEYDLDFKSDTPEFIGRGNGHVDKHFGSTEPLRLTMNGVRTKDGGQAVPLDPR